MPKAAVINLFAPFLLSKIVKCKRCISNNMRFLQVTRTTKWCLEAQAWPAGAGEGSLVSISTEWSTNLLIPIPPLKFLSWDTVSMYPRYAFTMLSAARLDFVYLLIFDPTQIRNQFNWYRSRYIKFCISEYLQRLLTSTAILPTTHVR